MLCTFNLHHAPDRCTLFSAQSRGILVVILKFTSRSFLWNHFLPSLLVFLCTCLHVHHLHHLSIWFENPSLPRTVSMCQPRQNNKYSSGRVYCQVAQDTHWPVHVHGKSPCFSTSPYGLSASRYLPVSKLGMDAPSLPGLLHFLFPPLLQAGLYYL
jgi:hypothetical protein